MGNEHCCDDKNKGGQFKKRTQKVNGRLLHKTSTSDVQKSFYNQYPKTKNTIPSNGASSPRQEEEGLNKNISSNLIKMLKGQQELSSERDQEYPCDKDRFKKPSFEHVERLSFSKGNGNESVDKILDIVPELTQPVKKIYEQQKFFSEVEAKDMVIREYGNQIYEGQIDNNMPNGFGKFYKQDNSFFIGYFQNGKAHGKGAYIFSDGSYYYGDFVDNKAQCEEGDYYSKDLSYYGGFKENSFHGKGEEEGPNYTFKGFYANGVKASGVLTWSQGMERYKYEGTFDENSLFHGNGRLEEPTGCYQGDFEHGYKHGLGSYKFMNLITYQGQYNYNIRQGHGKLCNPGGKLAYQGEFKDGLPHGKGLIPGRNGTMQPTTWIMGIDSSIL